MCGRQHTLFLNLYVPFNINGAVTHVQVTHATGKNIPHTVTDAYF